MTTVDASRPTAVEELDGRLLHEAPPCPSCEHPSSGQSLLRAEMDGAFFRADFECESCRHDHPVWYDD